MTVSGAALVGQVTMAESRMHERRMGDRGYTSCRWIWRKSRKRTLCALLLGKVSFRLQFWGDAKANDAAWWWGMGMEIAAG